ncbi:hypothetical protein [Nocardioides acrostichi]|uniref:Uncharacterized protein n=1 Tax=Nocardioides acrostichi TaxID=2784339 RepID=A0A930Y8Y3_9ACTN|nr:hypothetical protein [Nocardioides acrostichi]MBF4163551.1 hypothetical protein [Nocardioides acrostichi]
MPALNRYLIPAWCVYLLAVAPLGLWIIATNGAAEHPGLNAWWTVAACANPVIVLVMAVGVWRDPSLGRRRGAWALSIALTGCAAVPYWWRHLR